MEPQFIKKLKDVIREQVAMNNRVKINGLGEFHKIHQKQTQKKYEDGRIMILPPKDFIEFKPEIRPQNDDQ